MSCNYLHPSKLHCPFNVLDSVFFVRIHFVKVVKDMQNVCIFYSANIVMRSCPSWHTSKFIKNQTIPCTHSNFRIQFRWIEHWEQNDRKCVFVARYDQINAKYCQQFFVFRVPLKTRIGTFYRKMRPFHWHNNECILIDWKPIKRQGIRLVLNFLILKSNS